MSRELRSMIDRASGIVVDEFGWPSLLDAMGKAFIIQVKELMKLGNREMAYDMSLFGRTREISYKTVERLHSDPLVIMILNKLFIDTLRRKEIRKCDAPEDGTCYSLTVTKHYRSMRRMGNLSRKGSLSIHSHSWNSVHAFTLAMPFVSYRRSKPTGRPLR